MVSIATLPHQFSFAARPTAEVAEVGDLWHHSSLTRPTELSALGDIDQQPRNVTEESKANSNS